MMKKNIKVLEEDKKSQEHASGSEKSKVDFKGQTKLEKKPIIDHHIEVVRQSMLMDVSLGNTLVYLSYLINQS